MNTINERFREVRTSLDKKLSQEAFAKEIGLTRSELKNIEYSLTTPKEFTISQVCQKFRINETWLRTGVGEMQAEETHQEKLAAFFSDVLATAPDDRSAFIAALSDLPPAFWPLVVEQARSITASLKEKEKED